MDSVTVKNFRCFGDEQTVRLAPLTLLVGDNSTGKTSFLALIRALSYVAYGDITPNFRQPPYDLGSYGEIVHVANGANALHETFEAGFTLDSGEGVKSESNGHHRGIDFRITFKNRRDVPFPICRHLSDGIAWIEYSHDPDAEDGIIKAGIGAQSFDTRVSDHIRTFDRHLLPLSYAVHLVTPKADRGESEEHTEIEQTLHRLVRDRFDEERVSGPPFASAPVRSRPSRTYDPGDITGAPDGEHAPTFLARMSMLGGDEWETLRKHILDFGRTAGLFDDLKIVRFGDSGGSPFQIHVRKHGRRHKGLYRNLVDMGYGVSQILPILTELFRKDGADTLLLQQPEVHLHPSAQAALGTLFCSLAVSGKQIIAETHSDNIIDRVRMEVRDKVVGLKPDDVSILYFERRDSDVKIHSIRISERGEILDTPVGYRQFFMDEVDRSIGLVRLKD